MPSSSKQSRNRVRFKIDLIFLVLNEVDIIFSKQSPKSNVDQLRDWHNVYFNRLV